MIYYHSHPSGREVSGCNCGRVEVGVLGRPQGNEEWAAGRPGLGSGGPSARKVWVPPSTRQLMTEDVAHVSLWERRRGFPPRWLVGGRGLGCRGVGSGGSRGKGGGQQRHLSLGGLNIHGLQGEDGTLRLEQRASSLSPAGGGKIRRRREKSKVHQQ